MLWHRPRVFVDVVNGEYVPRKSILKSRSRENSVCSDTSESSAAEPEERRGAVRSVSWEDAACSGAGESAVGEEPQENLKCLPSSGTLEVCVCSTLLSYNIFDQFLPLNLKSHRI